MFRASVPTHLRVLCADVLHRPEMRGIRPGVVALSVSGSPQSMFVFLSAAGAFPHYHKPQCKRTACGRGLQSTDTGHGRVHRDDENCSQAANKPRTSAVDSLHHHLQQYARYTINPLHWSPRISGIAPRRIFFFLQVTNYEKISTGNTLVGFRGPTRHINVLR